MKEGIIIVVVCLCVFFAILFWNDVRGMITGDNKKGKKEMKMKEPKNKGKKTSDNADIKVLQQWDMPEELTEISGITYLDDQRFACVQDEAGTVFIYNTHTGKVEKEIAFAGTGDYEGIALVDRTLFVVRADGQLYEINNIEGSKPVVKEYKTGLTVQHNIESLCFDVKNNRLLLTGKEPDPGSSDRKLVYGFDLQGRKMIKDPVLSIDLSTSVAGASSSNKMNDFHPSGIGIHPITQELYIIDGPAAWLYIVDNAGTIKKNQSLGTTQFPQAEGISFSPSGDLFISSEGKKSKAAGTIVNIALGTE